MLPAWALRWIKRREHLQCHAMLQASAAHMMNSPSTGLPKTVAFLRRPDAYPHRPAEARALETHMSWVFLAGHYVYKLKKPVAYPFLDFTSLVAREHFCREEVRLNVRLAGSVYIDVVPLCRDRDGNLSLAGCGTVIDWLVHMHRLPAERMLDVLIETSAVTPADIQPAAVRLMQFYGFCPPQHVPADRILARFRAEREEDAMLLSSGYFALDTERTRRVLAMMESAFRTATPLIAARVTAGAYVEGHGDLRPEHVCLTSEPVFIDCLEFSPDLRIIDPFDEIAYLGLDCERLGAAWIGEIFLNEARHRLATVPPELLLWFYRAARALLRARLALAHLIEPNPRTPEKWERRAMQYILLAESSLRSLGGESTNTPG